MLAYVLDRHGHPLMPCKPRKARVLLASGKACVVRRLPFTIRLLNGSTGYRQHVTAGMDTGSKKLGVAAAANGTVLYQADISIRTDVSKKMERRAAYRRTRRGRKCRYRPARWLNRASMREDGRLAPSIRSKLESHLRERRFVESILPVTEWRVETAAFDIHKIANPEVADYRAGPMQGFYNVKAYVLQRDGYRCRSRQEGPHVDALHVHHIVFRSKGGTNEPGNLITLCARCHDALHAGAFEISGQRSRTRHATEMGIIKSALKRSDWRFNETFGYVTKHHRERVLGLAKSHVNDAVAICCDPGTRLAPRAWTLYKRHVACKDYQQTKGVRSQMRIPTGKLFGLRKFDCVETPKGTGFVKGKRSSGQFALTDIHGTTLTASVNVKRNTRRRAARTSTLTMEERERG